MKINLKRKKNKKIKPYYEVFSVREMQTIVCLFSALLAMLEQQGHLVLFYFRMINSTHMYVTDQNTQYLSLEKKKKITKHIPYGYFLIGNFSVI